MLILGFADYARQARRLADYLTVDYQEIQLHRFPDGESKVTLPAELPAHVALCRSLDQPNAKLVELLLCAQTARAQGVQRLTLIAPYLCYMRQDVAFHPGEAVSQQIIGRWLGELFDDIITVDPHLHRIERLDQAIVRGNAIALSATAPLGDYLRRCWSDPLLIGPDAESLQWVQAIAQRHGLEFGVATKQRLGDREVRVSLPAVAVAARDVVLVDDMISTGRTLIEAAEQIQAQGARSIQALVTHALCDDTALTQLRAGGIDVIGSTDSVPHVSNVVELAPLLGEAVGRLARL